jgi:hypothetical protein
MRILPSRTHKVTLTFASVLIDFSAAAALSLSALFLSGDGGRGILGGWILTGGVGLGAIMTTFGSGLFVWEKASGMEKRRRKAKDKRIAFCLVS